MRIKQHDEREQRDHQHDRRPHRDRATQRRDRRAGGGELGSEGFHGELVEGWRLVRLNLRPAAWSASGDRWRSERRIERARSAGVVGSNEQWPHPTSAPIFG
jgi:hypothetical protein